MIVQRLITILAVYCVQNTCLIRHSAIIEVDHNRHAAVLSASELA